MTNLMGFPRKRLGWGIYAPRTLISVCWSIIFSSRSTRENNFGMYRTVLASMTCSFFALDHINYARWGPVHLVDLLVLKRGNPISSRSYQNFSLCPRPFDPTHQWRLTKHMKNLTTQSSPCMEVFCSWTEFINGAWQMTKHLNCWYFGWQQERRFIEMTRSTARNQQGFSSRSPTERAKTPRRSTKFPYVDGLSELLNDCRMVLNSCRSLNQEGSDNYLPVL